MIILPFRSLDRCSLERAPALCCSSSCVPLDRTSSRMGRWSASLPDRSILVGVNEEGLEGWT